MSKHNECDMRDELRERFIEQLDDMRQNRYWEDTLTEIADGFVSIYTTDRVDQWRALGCPDVDDSGLIEGVTDIWQIIAVAIFEWASCELWVMARDAGLDD